MMTLSKGLAIAAGFAAVSLGGTAANAAVSNITLTADGSGGYSADFGGKETGKVINNTYNITVPVKGDAELSFSISKGTVSKATFNGKEFTYTAGTAGAYRMGFLDVTGLGAGTFQLVITGKGGAGGVLSGNIGLTPAVPEPASWALMISGVGFAGGMMRRNRKVRTTVAFA